MKRVVVIGAGMGGLTAALRLKHQGFDVTVVEKQARPGGRSNVLQEEGFRFDMGPTILVMKQSFDEFYRSLGLDFDERLDIRQLDPNYRIYYHDGTYVDLFANMARLAEEVEKVEPGAKERLFRFIGDSARKYELGMDFVERNYDHITDLANPRAGVRLVSTGSHQNLFNQVGRYFKSDKLRKAFSFHSMFLGLSPFDALAMYSLITYADLALGMYFPMGGIYSIIEDMMSLADEWGMEVRLNAPVAEICVENGKVRGVMLEGGEEIPAEIVVSNADLPYTYTDLIGAEHRREYPDKRFDRMKYACSGYVMYLGVDKVYDNVEHQALYFSEDYKANLDDIFVHKRLPDAPSFHLNIPSTTDKSLAPEGHSAVYILAPMPNLDGPGADIDWDEAAPIVRERILDQVETILDPDIRQHIVFERDYRPTDWLHDINAVHGTAFGSLSQGFFQSSFFRPHNKSRDIDGMYFVGQGTYPGIGMPMVLISSQLVTERITEEWQ